MGYLEHLPLFSGEKVKCDILCGVNILESLRGIRAATLLVGQAEAYDHAPLVTW
jgi:hypothetical protein